jgi:SPP1 gp7 family putative phage head morphogenesis protein
VSANPRPRTDAAAIVEFFEVPTGGAFNVAPEQAIGYFKAKGLKPTFSYAEMLNEAHDHSFTVAKMMNVDMLGQVRASLDSALANGTTFKEWSDSIIPVLQSGGWWGRKEVLDPLTGLPMIAQLGSPARLETIFRTNLQSAYAAGQWQEIADQAEDAPYLMYDAVDDLRVRPMHKSWDNKVLPVTSAWWKSHYPPNGWNCRCGVIQLAADELEALGLQPAAEPPDDGNYTWTNPRTGEKVKVPVGLDPGFEHNTGQSYLTDLNKLLEEKVAALPPDMSAAANSAAAQALQDQARAASIARQGKAAATAERATAAIKKAEEAAKQADAQVQLDAIAAGKETAGKGAGYKIKALDVLKKKPEWQGWQPTEKIDAVLALADDYKLKTETASKLSTYKKAVLEGKIPAPSLVKALKSLPADDQAAFLAKVDGELAAQAAKTAAAQAALAAEKAAAAAAAEAAKKAAEQAAADLKAAQEAAAKASAAEAAKAAAKAKKSTAKAKAATQAANAKAEAVTAAVDQGAPNPDKLIKIGEQRGSNPGGTYQDTETGAKWYIKQPASAEAARNEVLGGKLYELAGVEVPEMHIITLDGKPSIASKIVDGLTKGEGGKLSVAPGAREAFAVDAWLANWDVVGMGYDNLLLKSGRAFRVDTGGSLRFRAQGGLKGEAFGTSVDEIDSLRGSANPQAKSVFGPMSQAQLEDSVERVLRLSEADIRSTVAKYGPTDAAERALMADTLIARQANLAERFPKAAARLKTPEPPAPIARSGARVEAAEQAAIEASRVNGYSMTTDGGDIEGHDVLVSTLTNVAGKPTTRAFLKLRQAAAAKLEAEIAKTAGAAPGKATTEPTINIVQAKDTALAAIKSINLRAGKGEAWDQTCVTKTDAALKSLAAAKTNVIGALKVATDGKLYLAEVRDFLDLWERRLNAARTASLINGKAVKVEGTFGYDDYPGSFTYTVKAAPTPAKSVTVSGIKWVREDGEVRYQVAKFDKSKAAEGSRQEGLLNTKYCYRATLPDGTKLTYIPNDPSEYHAFAAQGAMVIDTPGIAAASTTRVFGVLDELGVDSRRATLEDRQILYLNALAKLRLIRDTPNPGAFARYNAITATGPEGVAQRLALIKREINLDITKSEAWKQVEGVRQAFGHGRAHQLRPDLDTPEFRKFEAEGYSVFHNPNGLTTDGRQGVFEKVKMVVDGGGTFASIMDRFRRGVTMGDTSSGGPDMLSGGGAYYFTRILKKNTGSGIYWKAKTLKRLDALSYKGDEYGRTTGDFVEQNRVGQTVESLRSTARGTGNETVFKDGISMFDDLEAIVLDTQAEVTDALSFMRSRGYAAWPDGRKLEDVIITKARRARDVGK